MLKCYSVMALRLIWAVEQTNHSRHNERTRGRQAEMFAFFFFKKKIKKNCYSFFLLPPSINILKKRLLLRHKNDPQVALKRFSSAKKDIMHWKEYDFVFVNDMHVTDRHQRSHTLVVKGGIAFLDQSFQVGGRDVIDEAAHDATGNFRIAKR